MIRPFDALKYSSPESAPMVRRQRLLNRLDDMRRRPVTLICGQAVQGKTALVADYVRRRGLLTAWMHLDCEDAASDRFYSLLLCALTEALHGGAPASPQPRTLSSDATRAAGGLQDSLVRIWRRLPPELMLVIDGLEKLDPEAPSLALIRRMAYLACERVRLILISRHCFPPRLQPAVLRRQAGIIDNAALSFTPPEIRSYFQHLHGIRLSLSEARRLHDLTDGWTGGLVLISQILQRRPRRQRQRLLSPEIARRLSRESSLFFSEEIFNFQDPALQEFLVCAALLDVIDAELLREAAGCPDAELRMRQLVRRNLFVQVLHDRPDRTLYRFNPLFRDFLRAIRPRLLSDRQRDAFYRDAAGHCLRKGRTSEAVDCFLRARDFEQAADGIRRAGIDWLIRGRVADLADRIGAFPAAMVHQEPWLVMLATLVRRIRGGARNIENFQTALAGFHRRGDTRGRMLALAFLIEAHVFSGNDPANCRRRMEEAEQLLATNSRCPHFTFAKSLLWLQLGLGFIVGGDNPQRGLSACRKAGLLSRQMGDKALAAEVATVTALGCVAAGDFTCAEQALRHGCAADTPVPAEYRLLKKLALAGLTLNHGDLPTAARHLDALGAEIDRHGLLVLYPLYLELRGRLEVCRRRFTAAEAAFRQLLEAAGFSGNGIYQGMAYHLKALIRYHQRSHADARNAVERAEAAFDIEKATRHLMLARRLKGLILIRLGQVAPAAALLEQALTYFCSTGDLPSQAETHLAWGLLTGLSEHRRTARGHLQAGLALEAKLQGVRFVHLSRRDREKIARLSREAGAPESGPASPMPADTTTDGPPPPFPGKRRLSTSDAAGRGMFPGHVSTDTLVIRTFGRFQVSIGGRQPIDADRWGGRRPRLLLKSIVVHGLTNVPGDILIEDLWPDSEPAAGQRNLKVTLHRLRKALEPSLARNHKSAYVKMRCGRVTLDLSRCKVDVQAFEDLCRDLRAPAAADDADRVLALGRRIRALYRGDFLPEEPYAPWVEAKRWTLREAYLAVLMQMAAVCEGCGMNEQAADCCRCALAVDPCHEEAGQRLMKLYAAANHRSEAVKVYRQLCRSLQDELGVLPDRATTRLYQRLIHA